MTLGLTDNTTSAADRGALDAAIIAAISARSDLAYDTASNVLTFTSAADGSAMTDLSFDITATDDTLVEANEDFDVTLASPASSTGITLTLGTHRNLRSLRRACRRWR